MPKLATSVTEKQIAKLEPRHVKYKLGDGQGLYLLIEPSGKKRWRMRFRRFGKESVITLGTYPDMPLSEARQRRDDVHRLIADGIDLVAVRREETLLKREQARQYRSIKPPDLQFSMSSDGGMLLETTFTRMKLSVSKVANLRAFLIATDDEAKAEAKGK